MFQTPPCCRLMRTFTCVLFTFAPSHRSHAALGGYLYAATFRCVFTDYQKALINSGGVMVTLAPNIQLLKRFVAGY